MVFLKYTDLESHTGGWVLQSEKEYAVKQFPVYRRSANPSTVRTHI